MANQTLKHRSQQIAMDGSQKMPQRIIGTLNDLADEVFMSAKKFGL